MASSLAARTVAVARTALRASVPRTSLLVARPATVTLLRGARLLSTTPARFNDYNDSNSAPSRSFERSQQSSGAPTKVIFVGNLPWAATPHDIAPEFFKFGEVVDINIRTDSETGRPKGFAHVTMATVEDAIKAVEALKQTPIFIEGRRIRTEFAAAPGQSFNGAQQQQSAPTTNIILFDYEGDEAGIQSIFGEHVSGINRIHVLRDRDTGASRRTAFVEFTSTELSAAALEALNGQPSPFGGELKMRFATPRAERTPRYNNRDGGRGGYGNRDGGRERYGSRDGGNDSY